MVIGMSRAFMNGMGIGNPVEDAARAINQNVANAVKFGQTTRGPTPFILNTSNIVELTQRMGFNDELIPGVKNLYLYGGLAALYFGFKLLKKKK